MKGFTQTILIITALYSSSLYGQTTGIITGIIADSSTSESLLGVTIACGEIQRTSDYIEGKYELELSAGEHEIQFSYLGYATLTRHFIRTITLSKR